MAAGYSIITGGAIALTAATAKTVLSLINASNGLIRLTEIGVSFDGVTPTAVPVLVELCSSTQGAAGTSSAVTPAQLRGPTRTVQATAAKTFTVEPTTITVLKEWLIRPDGGMLILQSPLGREPEQVVTADAYLIRVTAPAIVNVRAYIEFEEG